MVLSENVLFLNVWVKNKTQSHLFFQNIEYLELYTCVKKKYSEINN